MASGSIRKLLVDSISYNVAADANFAKTPKVVKEGIPHSGGNEIKITKAHGNVESQTLIVTSAEYLVLQAQAEALKTVPMSYTEADGSVWTSQGHINLENRESEENRVDITMIPVTGTWDRFSS